MSILIFPKNSKKKLSDNFWAYEWDCNCNNSECDRTIISEELVKKLQEHRDKWDRPVIITSGYRCPTYNKSKKVGGSKNSQHLYGKAADIFVYGLTPRQVHKDCQDFAGLGLYEKKGFCHVDVRAKKARWTG